jgi:phage-related protein
MATFNANDVGSDVSPSYAPVLQITPEVTTVKLGDGYE